MPIGNQGNTLNVIYQIHNINKNVSLTRAVLWVVAINLNIIIFYSGGVLFNLLQGDHQIAFALLCFLNIFLVFLCADKRLGVYLGQPILFILLLLLISLAATFVTSMNYTVLREAISLVVVFQAICILKYNHLVSLVKRIVVVHLSLLLLSIVMLISVLVGLIDYHEWNVLELDYISTRNPLYVKAACCAREIYNPYFILLLSETPGKGIGVGPGYERLLFLWNEPTGTPLYTIPMLLFLASQMSAIKRVFIISLSVALLLLTFSMTGILVAVFLGFLYMMVKMLGVRLSIMLGIMVTTLLVTNAELLLSYLGENKLGQYYYFKDKLDLIRQFSLFGLSADDELGKIGYGTTLVYVRYGVFGYLIYSFVYAYIFYRTLLMFRDVRFCSFKKILLPLSILFALLMSVRSNQLVLSLPLLLFFAAHSLYGTWWKTQHLFSKKGLVR